MRVTLSLSSFVLACAFRVNDLKRFAANLIRGSLRNAARNRHRVRLELQSLETRDCPAVINWIGAGAGANWNVGANWSGGVVPTAADDVVFDSAFSPFDCNYTIPGSPGTPIANSITLDGTYTGTLHLNVPNGPNPVVVGPGGIELDNGDIEQDQGIAIQSQGDFNWTGGNLNPNSPFLADFNVDPGKRENIGGATNETSGTNLNLTKSAVGVIHSTGGTTITFTKNAGIAIDSTSTVNWIDGDLKMTGTGVINNQGTFSKTVGVSTSPSTDLPINNSGIVQLQQGFTINGKNTNGYSFEQTKGTIDISSLQELTVKGGGFHMSGGNLWTEGSTSARITGNDVLIDGGTIVLNHNDATLTGGLVVTSGNLTIQGTAEVDVKIDPTGSCDSIGVIGGNITFGGKSTLKLVSINLDGKKVPARMNWTIFDVNTAGKTITGDFGTRIRDMNDGSGRLYTTGPNGDNTQYQVKS